MSINVIEPLSPLTAILPLAFVLLISTIREAYDEIVNLFN